jgi:hypothetical protein
MRALRQSSGMAQQPETPSLVTTASRSSAVSPLSALARALRRRFGEAFGLVCTQETIQYLHPIAKLHRPCQAFASER